MIGTFSNIGTFKVINGVLSRQILFPGHLFANISSLSLAISLLIVHFGMPAATAEEAMVWTGGKSGHAREETNRHTIKHRSSNIRTDKIGFFVTLARLLEPQESWTYFNLINFFTNKRLCTKQCKKQKAYIGIAVLWAGRLC